MVLRGLVQSGKNDASRWLGQFNDEYSRKTGMPIFPGSLNLALASTFDWFCPSITPSIIWFGMDEYGGERDILLLPCKLRNLGQKDAFVWTPTTAARDRPDPWVIEIITDINLREAYDLSNGSEVEVEILN